MKSDVYTLSGVPVIRGTNISRDRAWRNDWVYVSDDFADGLPNCNVREGDLVFPHRGSIGEVAIVPGDIPRYMLSSSLMKFRPDPEKVSPLFDGFGRELCRVHGSAARSRTRTARISFQNLEGARDGLLDLFGIDLSAGVDPAEWRATVVAFQQRHLMAHRFGVVDQEYIDKTGDARAVVGRKVIISRSEVKALVDTIRAVAHGMATKLRELKGSS